MVVWLMKVDGVVGVVGSKLRINHGCLVSPVSDVVFVGRFPVFHYVIVFSLMVWLVVGGWVWLVDQGWVRGWGGGFKAA